MALQQRVGILPYRRLGFALRHHPGPCLNGKNLAARIV